MDVFKLPLLGSWAKQCLCLQRVNVTDVLGLSLDGVHRGLGCHDAIARDHGFNGCIEKSPDGYVVSGQE